jgi:hypothetical protein
MLPAPTQAQAREAVADLTAQAKLAGFWVDRAENKNSYAIFAISDKPLTVEEPEQQCCHPAID